MCEKLLCKGIVKVIKEAYRRGWNILSFQYVQDCEKHQCLLDPNSYFLNVSVLKSLPSRSLYSIPVLGMEEREMSQQRSFLATAKKRLREERRSFQEDDIENQPRAHKRKQAFGEAPPRPAGAFAMFVKEKTDTVMKENPGTNAVHRLTLI